MNTTNFNKMGLIKVNGQWRFSTEEDEESEESTDATVDAPNNADSGAPGADAGEDNAEEGATVGAAGNTPMDLKMILRRKLTRTQSLQSLHKRFWTSWTQFLLSRRTIKRSI